MTRDFAMAGPEILGGISTDILVTVSASVAIHTSIHSESHRPQIVEFLYLVFFLWRCN